MHRSRSLAVVALALLACGKNDAARQPVDPPAPTAVTSEAEAEPTAMATAVEIIRSYSGRIALDVPAPGQIGPDHSGRVIRDQAGYQAFVDSIPELVIQMKQPSPPSDDPLLTRPDIDFGANMLLVATRSDMYNGPIIAEIIATGDDLAVKVTLPGKGDLRMASRADVGTYHAVVIPAVPGEVKFDFVPGPPPP